MNDIAKLRRRISSVVNIEEWNDIQEASRALDTQISRMEDLRLEYRHSISLIGQARRTDPLTYKYTCHMYAFDLMDCTLLAEVAGSCDEVFPGGEFVTFCTDRLLQQSEFAVATTGDFVVYFNGKSPTHSGKWHDGRVRSKWGQRGHLWQHGVYEVPLEYGSDVRVFQGVLRPEVERAYREWAHAKRRTLRELSANDPAGSGRPIPLSTSERQA